MDQEPAQPRKGQQKDSLDGRTRPARTARRSTADVVDEVTAAQAAALTGLSERTIRRKIASGKLPARRLAANRFAIRVRDLPDRPKIIDIVHRLDALERQVLLLEQTLVQVLAEHAATPDTASASRDADEGKPILQSFLT